MAQDQYGPAQGLIDFAKKYIGPFSKPAPKGSSTNAGKLPDAWEKANEESAKRQLMSEQVGKKRTVKPNVRTGPLANKRVPRKKAQ